MRLLAENLLFLQALLAQALNLQELVGEEWLEFRTQLLEDLDLLAHSRHEEELNDAVEGLLETGLDSPAAELFRSLVDQASEEVERWQIDSNPPPATFREGSQDTLLKVGQQLADRLRWGEVVNE